MSRRSALFLAVVPALLIGLFALGPRPEVDETPRPIDLPADLDAYLAAQERRYPDLRPQTEKTIVWADSSRKARTPLAVVYLHGFSATRQETAPLCDTLAARLGANLFYTRLRGHGRSDDAMAEASAADWLHDAREALAVGRRLGERMVVVGTSTGATLAAWLAVKEDVRDVAAFVLLSPNFGPRNPRARILLWPWGGLLARALEGPYRAWEPANEQQARYWTTRYPTRALLPMMALVDAVEELDLGRVDRPVLLVYSDNDQVVNPEAARAGFEEIGSDVKRLVAYNESEAASQHVLAGAVLAPNDVEPVAGLILEFLASLPLPQAESIRPR